MNDSPSSNRCLHSEGTTRFGHLVRCNRCGDVVAEDKIEASTSNEVLPCPFCGDSNRTHVASDGVRCGNCGCVGPWYSALQDAVASWNKRPALEPSGAPYAGRAKEHARDVHYQLIEHFGLKDTPTANYAVRQMLVGLTVHAEPPNDPRPAEYAALIRAFADWWLGHHDDSRFFNEAMQASPVLAVGMGDTLRQALTKPATTCDEETCPRCGAWNIAPWTCKEHGDVRHSVETDARIWYCRHGSPHYVDVGIALCGCNRPAESETG